MLSKFGSSGCALFRAGRAKALSCIFGGKCGGGGGDGGGKEVEEETL